jgi:hypothetical protein
VEGIKLKRAEGMLRLLRKYEGRVKFFGQTVESRDGSAGAGNWRATIP